MTDKPEPAAPRVPSDEIAHIDDQIAAAIGEYAVLTPEDLEAIGRLSDPVREDLYYSWLMTESSGDGNDDGRREAIAQGDCS